MVISSLPAPSPYLPLPTLCKGKVRDISLTDFKGSFLVIFFSSSVYENGEDLKVINHNVRQLKKHFCDILACSTDSTMLHSKWIQSLKEDDELKSEEFILPLMSDRTGQLCKMFDLFDEEEGVCHRSFLIIDDKCWCREVMVSSLSMSDLINTVLDTIIMIKSVKLDEVNTGDRTGFIDKVWRTTLKIPESPKKSMSRGARSTSRNKSPASEEHGSFRHYSKERRGGDYQNCNGHAKEFAESIVKLLKFVMSSLNSEADLPVLSAGEIKLVNGRVSGMWKVSRGVMASVQCKNDGVSLTFPVVLCGIACSYDFSGRRLRGEVSCCYESLQYQVTLSQKISSECFTNSLVMDNLSLAEVKGVRMNVTGFGPLNWIAGKSVTNVIQENVLQVVENHLKTGILLAITNASFYFQLNQAESPALLPAGILVS